MPHNFIFRCVCRDHLTVRIVNLSYNQFAGTIPDNFFPQSPIVDLNLESNMFTGPIPSSLANITGLSSLRLQFNRFDGRVPSEICNLRSDGLAVLASDCLPNRGLTDNLCECCTLCCERYDLQCMMLGSSSTANVETNDVCEASFRWNRETGMIDPV